jgi:hypothetical protein
MAETLVVIAAVAELPLGLEAVDSEVAVGVEVVEPVGFSAVKVNSWTLTALVLELPRARVSTVVQQPTLLITVPITLSALLLVTKPQMLWFILWLLTLSHPLSQLKKRRRMSRK